MQCTAEHIALTINMERGNISGQIGGGKGESPFAEKGRHLSDGGSLGEQGSQGFRGRFSSQELAISRQVQLRAVICTFGLFCLATAGLHLVKDQFGQFSVPNNVLITRCKASFL